MKVFFTAPWTLILLKAAESTVFLERLVGKLPAGIFLSGSVKRTPSKSVEPTIHETNSSPLKMDGCKLEDLNDDPNPTPKDVFLIQPGCTLLPHGF